jgi:hypothetical protein
MYFNLMTDILLKGNFVTVVSVIYKTGLYEGETANINNKDKIRESNDSTHKFKVLNLCQSCQIALLKKE